MPTIRQLGNMKKRQRRPKLTIQDIREFLTKNDCTLITDKYLGTKQLLEYRCNKCNKINVGCYNNLYRFGRKSRNKYFCLHCWKATKIEKKQGRLKKIVLRNQLKLFTITEAAAYLGVHYSDFYAHVRYKKTLPEPTHAGPYTTRKKYYTEIDLMEIQRLIY